LGLFVAVLLTPIYLQRDFEKNDSDEIIDPHTGGTAINDATTSATKATTTNSKPIMAETTRTTSASTVQQKQKHHRLQR
jgi:hypothetical protein